MKSRIGIGRRAQFVLLSACLLTASDVRADTREFSWDELQRQGEVRAGTVVPPGSGTSFHALRVENNSSQPVTINVLTVNRPSISGPQYIVNGQVRYERVEGIGYLEMWNHFPGGGRYFSRTLAETGPMMRLSGDSAWRPFELPFDATGAPSPTQLMVNVVLAGRGVVYLGPLTLSDRARTEFDAARDLDRIVSIGSSVAGAVLGSLGALIGVFTSLGRARPFVMASTKTLIAIGALSLAAGIGAYASSQPPAVYYPLLLLGVLASMIPLGLLPSIRKRYQDIELRAMRAHDLA